MPKLPQVIECQELWQRHRLGLLRLAIGLMILVSVFWLGYEFWRLLWAADGAIDLLQRYREVNVFFDGKPVYFAMRSTAMYPPASYVLFWPMLGWLSATAARWFWAVTMVAALVWLVRLAVQESLADTSLERIFVALMPVSMYATGATIGNGQLLVFLLPLMITGVILLRESSTLLRDLMIAALMLLCLVKPSAMAPFFWIVLFVPGTMRPALLVVLAYILLTIIAAWVQQQEPLSLMGTWYERATGGVKFGNSKGGYANTSDWLNILDIHMSPQVSFSILVALGAWVCRFRKIDIWLLMGVVAMTARFWTYHAWYDDMLFLLPMITLFRIAKQKQTTAGRKLLAGCACALMMCTLLAPGGLYLFSEPWDTLYVYGQVSVWLFVLAFLLEHTWREARK